MAISFEGFPRILERSALRPGRWFVAGDRGRALLGFVTEIVDGPDLIALTFVSGGVEQIDFAAVSLGALTPPFATVEDELVFAPGMAEGRPMLVAPARRAFRSGSLLRLKSGDLGLGFAAGPEAELAIVSLVSGQRAESFDLVFDRWSIRLRRGPAETLLGYFKPPLQTFGDRRRG